MSEFTAGLSVQRPVLNLNQAICDRLWNLAEDQGLPRGLMARLLSEDSVVELLKPYEIRNAQQAAGIRPTAQANEDLAADLEELLAETTPEYLRVPTYPVHESTPRNRRSRCLFSVGVDGPASAGRAQAIQAVNTIYGLVPPAGEETTVWHDSQYHGGVEVTSIKRDPSALRIVRYALDIQRAVLPTDTELGLLTAEYTYE